MSDQVAPKRKSPAIFVVGAVAFAAGAAAGGGGAVLAVMTLHPAPTDKASRPETVVTPIEYFEIDNAFTSNLADTGRYLQLRLSVSTTGGLPVTAALLKHKPAIVSAVLGVLGEAGEADVADLAAKTKLRASIRASINDVLRRNGKAGGVDDVFFTSLVVQ